MTSAVELIRSTRLSGVAQYAYAACVPAGVRLVFLAGSCPLDSDGRTVAAGDFAAQATQCVANLRTALEDAGASLTDVVSTRVLVASTRRADLVSAWAVVREAFGQHDVPSTLMGVTVLGYDGQLVELEAVAAVRDTCPPAGRADAESTTAQRLRLRAAGGGWADVRHRLPAAVGGRGPRTLRPT